MNDSSSDMDEFEQVYRDFRRYLSGESKTSDFTEEELLDIFDYAGDLADEYVRMQVLLYARGHMPLSRRLREREVLYLISIGELDGAMKIARRLPPASFISRVALIRCGVVEDNYEDALEAIIKGVRPGALSDEEAIQLVTAFDERANADVLFHHVDRIAALCEFPETFLYELALSLRNANMLDEARELSARLTSIEPYSTEFWSLNAELNLRANPNYEEAQSSIDYALAIDPTCVPALRLKHQLLYSTSAPEEELEPILADICRYAASDATSWYNMAVFLAGVGRNEEATAAIKKVLLLDATFPCAVEQLFRYTSGNIPDDMSELVRKWIAARDDEELTPIIMNFVDMRQYDVALSMLYACESVFGDLMSVKLELLVLELLYRVGRYQDVVDRAMSMFQDLDSLSYSPDAVLLYSLARKKLGDTEGLAELIDMAIGHLHQLPYEDTLEDNYKHVGRNYYLLQMHNALTVRPDVEESYYDPFWRE